MSDDGSGARCDYSSFLIFNECRSIKDAIMTDQRWVKDAFWSQLLIAALNTISGFQGPQSTPASEDFSQSAYNFTPPFTTPSPPVVATPSHATMTNGKRRALAVSTRALRKAARVGPLATRTAALARRQIRCRRQEWLARSITGMLLHGSDKFL
jgi:hypothetical protein